MFVIIHCIILRNTHGSILPQGQGHGLRKMPSIEIQHQSDGIHTVGGILVYNILAYIRKIITNSVDPDEMARYESSHMDLHCLPLCD